MALDSSSAAASEQRSANARNTSDAPAPACNSDGGAERQPSQASIGTADAPRSSSRSRPAASGCGSYAGEASQSSTGNARRATGLSTATQSASRSASIARLPVALDSA